MAKLRKYTDEELSRILSTAAVERLGAAGFHYSSCIEQAALVTGEVSNGGDRRMRQAVYNAWDNRTSEGVPPRPNPEQTLRWLESKGLA